MQDNELKPVGDPEVDPVGPTPQDWGFPVNPTQRQRTLWYRQEMFLAAYAKCGRITEAAKCSGITRWCVDKWQQSDTYAIKKRMELAHAEYVEAWERWMDDRLQNPQGNRGSDVLGMFKLKAEKPEKYREEVKVMGMEGPLAMLDRLKELAIKERQQRELESGKVVEAEVKEIDSKEGG
jgi:hypothetical protein